MGTQYWIKLRYALLDMMVEESQELGKNATGGGTGR